ncbi:GNAT family N-acetyltransferase [Symbioplanes lichenis]|uniref:GNAT family N-acetyltransferase n=1 Tax=Symbioplanes lichenis TaxID=1629072 RepID=UPI002738E269|nr:GNAT family N-acetyltransferase [Actinoplanes lichenis]
MNVELVPRFTVDDAELSALHARAFGNDPAEIQPWSERLHRHALTWLGAFAGDRLTGFVYVAWDGGTHAFLLDPVVDPAHRHQGLGTALVKAAADAARAAGCTWLHVDFEPHLKPFYLEECGFRATAAGLLRLP